MNILSCQQRRRILEQRLQEDEFDFLVEVGEDGNLCYNNELIQSTVLSNNANNQNVTTFGIVDDVSPEHSMLYNCAESIQKLLAQSMQPASTKTQFATGSTPLVPISEMVGVNQLLLADQSIGYNSQFENRNVVLIRKVPYSNDLQECKNVIFVLYLWMGNNGASQLHTNTKFTKLVDFIFCASSVVFAAQTQLPIFRKKLKFLWAKSICSTPHYHKFGNFPAMTLFLRCIKPTGGQVQHYATLQNKHGQLLNDGHERATVTSAISTLVSGSFSKAIANFSTLTTFVTMNQYNGNGISYKFEPSKFETICGPSSKHPVKASTLEELVVRIVTMYNAAMQNVPIPSYESHVPQPSSTLDVPVPQADTPMQFVHFYKDALANLLQVQPKLTERSKTNTLSEYHSVAVFYAKEKLLKASAASQPKMDMFLHPEIVALEKDVLDLEQKLHEKLQDLETKFAMNLLKNPRKMTAKNLESLVSAGAGSLTEIINKFAAGHLKQVASAFVQYKIASLRKLAEAFEWYVISMTKLLNDRIFLHDDELLGHHLGFLEATLSDPLCKVCPLATSLLESAIVGFFECCALENSHKQKTTETLFATASTLLFQAYKTTMTDALNRAVFTPEQLSNTHELASASAMRSFNDLRTDKNSSIWESYAQKATAILETEFSLLEEMNSLNAIEVQQRGETIVEALLKGYKNQLGNNHQLQAHEEAKHQAVAAFDTQVANDTRRSAVQMWRQKLIAGINAHSTSIKDRHTAEQLPSGFLRLKSSDKPLPSPKPNAAAPTSRRRGRDLDNALKRLGAKLSTTEASSAVVAQVKKVVQTSIEVLNRRDASDAEIDVAVRKLELWEKSIDKSNA